MNEPLINTTALRQPRNRRLLIIAGVALLALLVALAVWQMSGTNGARRDLAAANDKLVEKQKEVDDALRAYQQKVAELRVVQAEADAKATTLGTEVDRSVDGAVREGLVDAPMAPGVTRVEGGDEALTREYYVRDRRGRFVRVTNP